jgi:hypothetical protein
MTHVPPLSIETDGFLIGSSNTMALSPCPDRWLAATQGKKSAQRESRVGRKIVARKESGYSSRIRLAGFLAQPSQLLIVD